MLPADFDARYSSEQRALMVAHERMHIVRGDLHANALTAAMRCVFWFNPLLHLAARHFRHDQELACDLRVIARHPHARRAYGEAMFKTQLALHPLPLGCHWGYSHPLKERIAMLKQPVPSLSRWIGGAVLVGVLALGVGFAAWSAQPARAVVSHDVPPPPPLAPPPPPMPPAPPSAAHDSAARTTGGPCDSTRGSGGSGAAPPPPALPAPAYPKDALAQHINGKVVLLIDIDAQGNPTNVVVDQSEPAGRVRPGLDRRGQEVEIPASRQGWTTGRRAHQRAGAVRVGWQSGSGRREANRHMHLPRPARTGLRQRG